MLKQLFFPALVAAMTVAVAQAGPQPVPDEAKGGRQAPAFADFDQNGDGGISQEEFDRFRSERIKERSEQGRRLKNLAIAPTFNQIDANDDGAIDRKEFATHQAEQREKQKQRNLEQENRK